MDHGRTTDIGWGLGELPGLDRIDPQGRREAAAYLAACAPGLDSVPVRGHL
jgi:hypothetical protein